MVNLGCSPFTDSVIQKVKWHFNHISSIQMDSSLEKIQEELEFQPPVVLTLEDTDVANGIMNGHTQIHLEPAPNFRMEPVTALGVLSLILNIMCAALNLIRGIHLAEHSLQVAHEEIGNILAFLIPFLACIFQCYLYLFYSPARTMKVVLLLLFICLGNIYLHGLRNLWQILFHIGVAFLSSYQILTRQLQEKQADCGVWRRHCVIDGSFGFLRRVICISLLASQPHLKFPPLKFPSIKNWLRPKVGDF